MTYLLVIPLNDIRLSVVRCSGILDRLAEACICWRPEAEADETYTIFSRILSHSLRYLLLVFRGQATEGQGGTTAVADHVIGQGYVDTEGRIVIAMAADVHAFKQPWPNWTSW
jgi:hypothetical protein